MRSLGIRPLRLGGFALALGVVLIPSTVRAQDATPITADDTVAIWIAALDTVRQEMWRPFRLDQPLWLEPRRSASASSKVLAMLHALIPDLRVVDARTEIIDLFECPPGVRLSLPGQGCPIRDGGRIVGFVFAESSLPEEIRVIVNLTHSAADGSWTQAYSREVVLGRDPFGGWRVLGLGWTIVS